MMNLLEVLQNTLPQEISLDHLRMQYSHFDWTGNPTQASIAALAATDMFDFEDYLRRYPDVAVSGMDPIGHFVNYGIRENRKIRIKQEEQTTVVPEQQVQSQPASPDSVPSYSIIVTLWKRKNYLSEQYLAFKRQSIKPCEIIYLINENHISPDFVRKATGKDVKIIHSDINSLYTRFAICYIAKGEYVTIVDDDIIPGELWFANAMRACRQYNAYVVGSGRIYNTSGVMDFFTQVMPNPVPDYPRRISCATSDIFCDWGCNSYFFKRDWLGKIIGSKRNVNANVTSDDLHHATSLYMNLGIKCVCPIQPAWDKRLHASLKDEYGGDSDAVWRTASAHFEDRKSYLPHLIKDGYIPIHFRTNLYRFHIIMPFGERSQLKRCLLSLKAQVYQNYTCTLVDDCCDGQDALALVQELGLDSKQFRYILNRKKLFALRGHVIAMDLLPAAPADIIVHLDGDDWFAHPHVLWSLNRLYRKGNVAVTYGGEIAFKDWNRHDFREYDVVFMSRRWNMVQEELDASMYPASKLGREDVANGWERSRWFALHTRSFQFGRWLTHNRESLKFRDGRLVKFAYDGAILIPILNNCSYEECLFTPELSYIYQEASNTTCAKKLQDYIEAAETRRHIADVDKTPNGGCCQEVTPLAKVDDFETEIDILLDNIRHTKAADVQPTLYKPLAADLVVVATPDRLPEAVLALEAYCRNVEAPNRCHIFIATRDVKQIAATRSLLKKTPFHPVFANDLVSGADYERQIAAKFSVDSREYGKAVAYAITLHLLHNGAELVAVIGTEHYAVADLSDIQQQITANAVSLFPHFFDPANESGVQKIDANGLYDCGMFACRRDGEVALKEAMTQAISALAGDPENFLTAFANIHESFAFHQCGAFINTDKGIDYSPSNQIPAEGLVSPNQRGFLLKSGHFVRMWRLEKSFIHETANGSYWITKNCRLMLTVYMQSLLLLAILLEVRANIVLAGKRDLSPSRYCEEYERVLNTISIHIDIHPCHKLLLRAISHNIATDEALTIWGDICLDSLSFDNLEIFARLLEKLFPENETAKIQAARMRRTDFRYITENLMADPHLNFSELEKRIGAVPFGEIVKRRLELLKDSGIQYW